MGLSGAGHGWGVKEGGGQKSSLPKTCLTYTTATKLGPVIRDTPLNFCCHKYFFTGNHQILLNQEIQI